MFHEKNNQLIIAARNAQPNKFSIKTLCIVLFLLVGYIVLAGIVCTFAMASIVALQAPNINFLDLFSEDTSIETLEIVFGADGVLNPDRMALISLFGTLFMALFFTDLMKRRQVSRRDMGFNSRNFTDTAGKYSCGYIIGFALMAITVCLGAGMHLWQIQKLSGTSWIMLGLFCLGYIIQGMAEEVMFRGTTLILLLRKMKTWPAILISSLIFAAFHLGNPGINVLAYINLILFGVLSGILFLRHENIYIVSAMHSAWNFTQGNIFGISVSGTGLTSSIWRTVPNELSDILTGGDFGIEGSILTTATLVVVLIIIFLCSRAEKPIAAESEQAA